jgi:hypothetical protein
MTKQESFTIVHVTPSLKYDFVVGVRKKYVFLNGVGQ